jgi:hypothetical protein
MRTAAHSDQAGYERRTSRPFRLFDALPRVLAKHLQYIKRSEACRIEEALALALTSAGLLVKGGH